ncbi:aminoacyl-tRNA hydrolase [soil metagenome]
MIRRVLRTFRRDDERPANASRLVFGLGNVGSKYVGTRHNLGFEVVDELARRENAGSPRNRFDAQIFEISRDSTRVVLAAPTTMMNLSGHAVSQLARWYKMPPSDILVVYDELDIPLGKIRLRHSGGPGGHNGVKSVIDQLGTTEFPRLRIGVGRPRTGSTIGFLLSRFSADERRYVPEIVSLAADATECWIDEGIDTAMNRFNTREVAIQASRARS